MVTRSVICCCHLPHICCCQLPHICCCQLTKVICCGKPSHASSSKDDPINNLLSAALEHQTLLQKSYGWEIQHRVGERLFLGGLIFNFLGSHFQHWLQPVPRVKTFFSGGKSKKNLANFGFVIYKRYILERKKLKSKRPFQPSAVVRTIHRRQ